METKAVKFGEKLVTTTEFLAEGHSFCIGCGEALAIRLAMKALGENVIMAMATGCDEVTTTPLPIPPGESPGCIRFSKILLLKSQA